MRNIDIKMKLKLIVGLIGVLSLSSFSTLPSSDDTDKKEQDRKSTRLNSSHRSQSRMPSSA